MKNDNLRVVKWLSIIIFLRNIVYNKEYNFENNNILEIVFEIL